MERETKDETMGRGGGELRQCHIPPVSARVLQSE